VYTVRESCVGAAVFEVVVVDTPTWAVCERTCICTIGG